MKKGSLWIMTGMFLLLVALFSFLSYEARLDQRERAIAEEQKAFTAQAFAEVDRTFAAPQKAPQKEETAPSTLALQGYLEIPKLALTLPIYQGTSAEALRFGTGLLDAFGPLHGGPGTVAVLAGHRGGYNGRASFLHIDALQKGDLLQVDLGKTILTYEVVGQKIISAEDWQAFPPLSGAEKLVLLTCHPYPTNEKRLLVEAILKSSENKKDPNA